MTSALTHSLLSGGSSYTSALALLYNPGRKTQSSLPKADLYRGSVEVVLASFSFKPHFSGRLNG